MNNPDELLVRTVLLLEAQSILDAVPTVAPQIVDAAKALVLTTGTVVCSGVGKSGFVANKFSSVLRSVGIPSLFLQATEALHGDLGFLRPNDSLVLVSKSARTSELQILHQRAKELGCKTIGVFSSRTAPLSAEVDYFINAHTDSEADQLGLLPTASSTLALASLDALASQMASLTGYTEQIFARNHPGGSLGRETSISVSDTMVQVDLVGRVSPTEDLSQAAAQLTKYPHGLVLVEEARGGEVLGVLTDGDLRRAIQVPGFSSSSLVRDFMTTTPLFVEAHDSIRIARDKLESHNPLPVFVAPVLRCGEVVGLITLHLISQIGTKR